MTGSLMFAEHFNEEIAALERDISPVWTIFLQLDGSVQL